MEQILVPLTQECFLYLVEIGTVVLEKKILKVVFMYFSLSSSLGKGVISSFEQT